MIKIQREAKSRIGVPVVSANDPSGGLVSFAFALRGERPTAFVAGTWLHAAVLSGGSWVRDAATPRIGDVGLDLSPGRYRFYGKLVLSGDEDIWEVDDEGLVVE